MKAILMSIKPKWCALIMNKDKKIEVRKGTTLYKAIQKLIDENGYADIYAYCTKGKRILGKILNIWTTFKPTKWTNKRYNGKVIFKFRCYKVEEIWNNRYKMISFPRNDYVERPTYKTENIAMEELLKKSCLTEKEISSYLELSIGYAIHISDLEIFDKPKELYEFHKPLGSYDCNHNCGGGCNMCWCEGWETRFHFECEIQKAPQSWCYTEVD